MGYSTSFKGHINISPPASDALRDVVNSYCESKHHDEGNVPGLWCDYRISPDGGYIEWNGSEKSYDMDRWLAYLIKNFFAPAGCVLDGQLEAQGEKSDDRWIIDVRANVVRWMEARLVGDLDTLKVVA